jgi:ADP-ribose pyrophosphatase YjhB (NUDIX family)
MRRREFVAAAGLAPLAPGAEGRKKIAAVSSTYHVRSHSDNFITRFLEGYWIHEQYHPPQFDVASLWMDQIHPGDIGQRLAKAYAVKPAKTIAEAVTLGTGKLAVDGVVIVCEHGNYVHNERNQQLYPRFEFFEQVVKVFRESGRSCPVFTDKHLSYDWSKAKQMYDWSRELRFPLMAGSSVPVTFRRPGYDPPLGVELESALSVGGGWVADGGIFHILETLQAFVERRRKGETGVKAVQMLKGAAVWEAAAQKRWDRSLLDAALKRAEKAGAGRPEDSDKAVLGIVEYRDGFRGAVLALGDLVSEYLVAVKPKGKPAEATLCYIPSENSNNFSMLVHGIAKMIESGQPAIPVERTLLVSGTLAALMESGFQGGKRIETPHLKVAYKAPAKSWFAAGVGS